MWHHPFSTSSAFHFFFFAAIMLKSRSKRRLYWQLKSWDEKNGLPKKHSKLRSIYDIKSYPRRITLACVEQEKWCYNFDTPFYILQEVTVKGLEPDIQKLIAKHKAEVKKLKSTHQVTAFEWDRFSCDNLFRDFSRSRQPANFARLLPKSSPPTFYIEFHLSRYCRYLSNI